MMGQCVTIQNPIILQSKMMWKQIVPCGKEQHPYGVCTETSVLDSEASLATVI